MESEMIIEEGSACQYAVYIVERTGERIPSERTIHDPETDTIHDPETKTIYGRG